MFFPLQGEGRISDFHGLACNIIWNSYILYSQTFLFPFISPFFFLFSRLRVFWHISPIICNGCWLSCHLPFLSQQGCIIFSSCFESVLFFFPSSVRTESKLLAWCSFLSVPRSSCLRCWRFATGNKIIDYQNIFMFFTVYYILRTSSGHSRVYCSCLHLSDRRLSSHPLFSESFLTLLHKEKFEEYFQLQECSVSCLTEFVCSLL